MSYACFVCDKKTVSGRSQRHHRGVAGKRWSKRAPMTIRTFRPNLQKATILVSGKPEQVKICAKCLKRYKKNQADNYSSAVSA